MMDLNLLKHTSCCPTFLPSVIYVALCFSRLKITSDTTWVEATMVLQEQEGESLVYYVGIRKYVNAFGTTESLIRE